MRLVERKVEGRRGGQRWARAGEGAAAGGRARAGAGAGAGAAAADGGVLVLGSGGLETPGRGGRLAGTGPMPGGGRSIFLWSIKL